MDDCYVDGSAREPLTGESLSSSSNWERTYMGYQGLSKRPLQHARAQMTRESARTQNCRSLLGTLRCPGGYWRERLSSCLCGSSVWTSCHNPDRCNLTGRQRSGAQHTDRPEAKGFGSSQGPVDEMLKALYENGFDLTKCPEFSYVSGVSEITRENPTEKWTATATAYKDLGDCIWVVGEVLG